MKLIVYTALFGDIDYLWSALPGCSDVQHIAFVDELKVERGAWSGNPPRMSQKAEAGEPTWEQRIVDPKWGSRRTARRCKILSHHYLQDADAWIWVDANVRARIHPLLLMEKYTEELIGQRHWRRKCLYEEAEACVQLEKDSPEMLRAQVERYRQDGMPEKWGLCQTQVLIRRNTAAIQRLNRMWWNEIKRGSCRDQVSLPWVCWKLGMRWDNILGGSPRYGRGDFIHIRRPVEPDTDCD